MLIPSILPAVVTLIASACAALLGDTPSLEEIVERATRFQQGSAESIPSGSVHGRFHLKWRKPDGTGMLTFSIERTYVRDPERMLTRRVDFAGQTDMSEGYDGHRNWVLNNKSAESFVLQGDPLTFATDLEQSRQQLRIMRMVHDALSVRGLVAGLDSPRVEGAVTLRPPRTFRQPIEGTSKEPGAWAVVGTMVDDVFDPDLSAPPPMPGDPLPRMLVRLGFSKSTGALLSMELATLERGAPRVMELWFGYHGANAQGLVVPQNLKVIEDGVESVSLGLAANEDGTAGLTLGERYDGDLFAVPAGADAGAGDGAPRGAGTAGQDEQDDPGDPDDPVDPGDARLGEGHDTDDELDGLGEGPVENGDDPAAEAVR